MRRARLTSIAIAAAVGVACGAPEEESRADAGDCHRPPCADARTSGCSPTCGAGALCIDARCVEACNPPCSPGFTCTAARTCAPDDTGVDTGGDVAEPTDGSDLGGGDVVTLEIPAVDAEEDGADAEEPGAGADARPDLVECVAERLTAEPVVAPVAVVLAVDTSGSMDQESETVAAKLNEFAGFITAAAPDLRVVLVADGSVCIPPPLSGVPSCPDADSVQYLHVRHDVDSQEVFSSLMVTFPDWGDFLQADAVVHLVGVSDDNDDEDWSGFRARMESSLGRPFLFHAIVAMGSIPFVGCIGWQGAGAAVGQEYVDLARATGGVSAPICTPDWSTVFRAIADTILSEAVLPCVFPIPDPGPGLELDTDAVNVRFRPAGGTDVLLPNVASESECRGRSAWYYDDPVEPTRIHLCPAVCGDAEGTVDIELGCETVKL